MKVSSDTRCDRIVVSVRFLPTYNMIAITDVLSPTNDEVSRGLEIYAKKEIR